MTDTITIVSRRLRAKLGFIRMPDAFLVKQLDAIRDGLTGNPAFPSPPVEMATFAAAIDSLNTLIVDALDGGKKAVSAKRSQRDVVIRMARQLGHYVERIAEHDSVAFNTSGFVAASNVRRPPQPLPPASIKWVDRGPVSGAVRVKIRTIPGAVAYDLRYVVAGSESPISWTSITLPGPKTVTIDNLTPGATYAFQARALGRLGYTDWSDSTNFMCG